MAAVDAAEAAAIECSYPPTDKEVKHLGCVGTEGGVWELSICASICRAFREDKQQKKNA
jgi:hypothetical protein